MNEFHFSKPIKIAFTDLAKTIDDITKLYLKYDYEKIIDYLNWNKNS